MDLEFGPQRGDRMASLPGGRHQAGRLGGATWEETSKAPRPTAPCWDGTGGPERPPLGATVRTSPAGVLLNVAKCPADETLAKLTEPSFAQTVIRIVYSAFSY